MKAFLFLLTFGTLLLVINKSFAIEQPDNLIKLQRDIFTEIIRSHGSQIENQTILNWCEYEELAAEIGLSIIALKRAVYDSFIVAGSRNIQATESARQMSNEEWALYNNAIHSDINHYRTGIKKGLEISLPNKTDKDAFCLQAEQQALRTTRTITH
jgi:hypothetical protein